MKLKSYFSGTVEAAMDLARQELGEDALLVNARPATPETRYLGAYEVVFGIPSRQIPASKPAIESEVHGVLSGGSPSGGLPSSNDRLAQEVAGLKREFERMMLSFLEARHPASTTPGAPIAPSAQLAEPDLVWDVDATLGTPGAARAIVALVGPPGVGKTTTLIKLAARYGLSGRKPARILSTDVFRIAAADQLRSLASILGIGCDIAETAGALAQLLEEHRSKELIFIDTPGLSHAEMGDAAELAELIASHGGLGTHQIDTHLVLPAFMRASDMSRTIEQYAPFRPGKLLFTRVDETGSHQDWVATAARHCLPISFLGTGQQIPDDLEPAERSRIEALLGQVPQTKGAAA